MIPINQLAPIRLGSQDITVVAVAKISARCRALADFEQARRGFAFEPSVSHTRRSLDNITHSLFGYALGRAWASGRQRTADVGRTPRTRALVASTVVASNAPDLDFVTGLLAEDRQLVYLLEHRGFTHTLIFALVGGLLVGAACAALYRVGSRRVALEVCALASAASLLHIGFDFLNDYGVHPFYPFDDRWYYGDSVFIIEPLLLAVLIPLPLWFALGKIGRGLGAAIAVGLLLLVWLPAQVPWWSAMVVTVTLAGCVALQRWFGARAAPALAGSVLVVSLFGGASQLAEAQVAAALAMRAPSERVLDIASSPMPGNPSCFRALVVTLDEQSTYRARLVRNGLLDEWLPAALRCRLMPAEPTAPLREDGLAAVRGVHFESAFAAPVSELSALAAEHCDAAAMLKFLRVPFWTERSGPAGSGTLLGDLRYDREPGVEFAERWLNGRCPNARAPWVPPRSAQLAD